MPVARSSNADRYGPGTDIRIEDSRPLTVRQTRAPQHTFNTTMLPWSQVPVLIAPVLAGETLKSAMIQARVMSSPVVSSVQGWWLEFYLFYVRVGDLDEADTMRAGIADPSKSFSSINQGALPGYYHQAALPCYAWMCHKVVSRAYFRKEGESWNVPLVGSYPATQIAGRSWTDSVYTETSIGGPPAGSDQWTKAWNVFQQVRSSKLTVNTWEEYLAKSGVRVGPQMRTVDSANVDVPDYRIPELVRFVRDFAYPVPTVDNATGTIRSTVQWSLAERIDKRRFFAEPGWLFGMMVCRPKVYLANQIGAMVDLIQADSNGFIVPEFETDPHAYLQQWTLAQLVTGGSGTTNAWMDYRDLFLYGDQWLGNPPGSGVSVALPTATWSNVKYPSATDAHNMFTDTANGVVLADGICSLRIASRMGRDATD